MDTTLSASAVVTIKSRGEQNLRLTDAVFGSGKVRLEQAPCIGQRLFDSKL